MSPAGASLPATFRDLAPLLPAELVGRRSRQAIAGILSSAPSPATTFGFEARLSGDDERVDVGIGLSQASGGAAALAHAFPSHADDGDPRRARLRAFANRWASDLQWRRRIPFVFLEYDEPRADAASPVPSLFAAFDWPLDELDADRRRVAGQDGGAAGLAEARQIITTLRREPLSVATRAILAHCFANPPAGGLVLHVGLMLGRPNEAVRLSLCLPRSTAAAYLASLGWEAGAGDLAAALRFHAAATRSALPAELVQIDIDLADGIGAAIGLTLQPHGGAGWGAVFELLVRVGLCTADKRDALLAWPGRTRGTRAPDAVERYLAHVKLVCGAGVAPRAKAYFGVRGGRAPR